jgi:hypothetical protein
MYQAKINGDNGVFKCPKVGKNNFGYELTQEFFVDNSGFGTSGEMALTASDFLQHVKAGFYYGITNIGQFQVYIGEFKKLSGQEVKKIKSDNGIVSSKKIKNNTRLTVYQNGDKIYRLHDTDIISYVGDKIILNSGGWDTVTTRSRFNEFLPLDIHVYRQKGVTYVSYKNEKLEFSDGMELKA